MRHDHFIVPAGKRIRLNDYDLGFTSHYKSEAQASTKLRQDIKRLDAELFVHRHRFEASWF